MPISAILPSARALCLVLPLLAIGGQALAQSDSSADRCKQISANDQRLACYDAVFGKPASSTAAAEVAMPAPAAAPAIAPAPALAPVTAAAPASAAQAQPELVDPVKEFGFEKLRGSPEFKLYTVVSAKRKNNLWLLEMDNGEWWRQKDNVSTFRVKEGDKVKIRSGFISAYYLSTEHSKRSIKVKRLK